jgi:hypothetical protein
MNAEPIFSEESINAGTPGEIAALQREPANIIRLPEQTSFTNRESSFDERFVCDSFSPLNEW